MAPPVSSDYSPPVPALSLGSLLRESRGEVVHRLPGVELRFAVVDWFDPVNRSMSVRVTANVTDADVDEVVISWLPQELQEETIELCPSQGERLSCDVTFEIPDALLDGRNIPLKAVVTVHRSGGSSEQHIVTAGYAAYSGETVTYNTPQEYWRFVRPDDRNVRRLIAGMSGTAGQPTGADQRLGAIRELHATMRRWGVVYRFDPHPFRPTPHAPFAQAPSELIYFGGDCEDLSSLYVSALLALGIEARLVITLRHVFVLASLGVPVREAASLPPEWLVTIVDDHHMEPGHLQANSNNNAWLPLEPTIHSDPQAFEMDIWIDGIFSAGEALQEPTGYSIIGEGNGVNRGEASPLARVKIEPFTNFIKAQTAPDPARAQLMMDNLQRVVPGPTSLEDRLAVYLRSP